MFFFLENIAQLEKLRVAKTGKQVTRKPVPRYECVPISKKYRYLLVFTIIEMYFANCAISIRGWEYVVRFASRVDNSVSLCWRIDTFALYAYLPTAAVVSKIAAPSSVTSEWSFDDDELELGLVCYAMSRTSWRKDYRSRWSSEYCRASADWKSDKIRWKSEREVPKKRLCSRIIIVRLRILRNVS